MSYSSSVFFAFSFIQLPEPGRSREKVSKREETSAWPLGTEFVISAHKKNFRTHRGRDKESLLVRKNKGKIEK
jgi:hypothetical protein